MKIVFFNDRKKPASVSYLKDTHDANLFKNAFEVVQPQDAKIFDVYVPDGRMPFIKVWETGQTLIDSVEAIAVADIEQV